MPLEIISHDEAFFEVWIEIVSDLFSSTEELPMTLLRIWLKVKEADGIRNAFTDSINILKFATLYKKLNFVP
jgi:hypothetical protein